MLKSLRLETISAGILATTFISAIIALTPITAALAKPADDNPYRAAYEEAITHGAMSRPSKVQDHKEALRLAAVALKRGDRHEAGKRAAQAIVIYSEDNSPKSISYVADSFAQTLGLDNLRQLPTFNAVMPPNISGTGGNRLDEFGWFRRGDGTPTPTTNVSSATSTQSSTVGNDTLNHKEPCISELVNVKGEMHGGACIPQAIAIVHSYGVDHATSMMKAIDAGRHGRYAEAMLWFETAGEYSEWQDDESSRGFKAASAAAIIAEHPEQEINPSIVWLMMSGYTSY